MNILKKIFSEKKYDRIPYNGFNINDDDSLYYAKIIAKQIFGKQYWDFLEIGVFQRQTEHTSIQIGKYVRNYSNAYKTFFPFSLNGQWYALYSKDYTSTRVMTLPDCKDLCGETHDTFGFCPVEYYVPKDDNGDFLPFGFVAGCVWGDDVGPWKIEFLDLSKIKDKILERSPRFGYTRLESKNDSLSSYIQDFMDNEYDEDEKGYMIKFYPETTFIIDKNAKVKKMQIKE